MSHDSKATHSLGRSRPRDFIAPAALLASTIGSWSIYQWVSWPFHWQSRLMHPVLFSIWTIAWHTTVRGRLAYLLGWRCPLNLALFVPPIAALGGEAIQYVWVAVGHQPEWAGAGFSLLGVGIGWTIIGMWRFLEPASGNSARNK
jgi:hypothetical protein